MNNSLKGKDILSISDVSQNEIKQIITSKIEPNKKEASC